MRPETIGKVCELCGTSDRLQTHHISYDPEIVQILCVSCHQKQHPGHGVGHEVGISIKSPLFDKLETDFIDLHLVVSNRETAAIKLGISRATAYHWDKKTGFQKYTGSTNLAPPMLRTPILQSVKDQLYELKDRLGHGNTGETIGYIMDKVEDLEALCSELRDEAERVRLEDTRLISDEGKKVIDDWMNAHGFETRYLALQDLLLEFRDRYLGEKAKKYGEG